VIEQMSAIAGWKTVESRRELMQRRVLFPFATVHKQTAAISTSTAVGRWRLAAAYRRPLRQSAGELVDLFTALRGRR
jgi:hypothetical protein